MAKAVSFALFFLTATKRIARISGTKFQLDTRSVDAKKNLFLSRQIDRHHVVTHPIEGCFVSAVGNEVQETYRLQANLPDWCALKWYHAAMVGVFVMFYLYFSYLPVPVLGVWHSVWSGGWIVNNGVYAADPSLPLAEGMRGITNGWLSHVVLHYAHWAGGSNLISILFAITQTFTLCIWAFVFVRIAGTWKAGFAAVFCSIACLLLVIGIEPRTFGELCFALTALVLTWNINAKSDSEPGSSSSNVSASAINWANAKVWQWIAIGVIMIAWANLDASFVVGLAWLACLAVGRLVDGFRGQNDVAMVDDRELKFRFYLFEAMIVVTLVTPYGWNLWQALLWWPDNPILSKMGGWAPTSLASWQGAGIGIAWMIWFYAAKGSTKIPAWAILSAIVATIATACCELTMVWLAPMIMFAAMAMFRAWPKSESTTETKVEPISKFEDENRPLRFAFTLICGLFIWIGFSLSPISQPLLGGAERTLEKVASKDAPIAMAKFMKQYEPSKPNTNSPNRLARLVWAPEYWGDWMQTDERVIPVFANANLRTLPRQVQADYRKIYKGDGNWKRILDRYAVTDLVIDKKRQKELYRDVRVDRGVWYTVYQDNVALVMRRKESRGNKK